MTNEARTHTTRTAPANGHVAPYREHRPASPGGSADAGRETLDGQLTRGSQRTRDGQAVREGEPARHGQRNPDDQAVREGEPARDGQRTTDGRGTRDAEVAANQRRRLVEAMVALSGQQGYAATTVAHLIAHAGVSRKTFYEHFSDRRDLLLSAFDATAPLGLEAARMASGRTGGSTRQLEATMRSLCRFAQDGPGSAVLITVDVAAASPEGLLRRDELIAQYGELIDLCLRNDSRPAEPALPPALAQALAGGAHRMICAQLHTGGARSFAELAPQLARWVRSHHPVPAGLFDAAQLPSLPAWTGTHGGLLGGRAPGTLTLEPRGYEPPAGERSRALLQHSNRERILDAVAQLVAEHGYTELTAIAIAERADLPERAFLAQFNSSGDAFAAAVELGHVKGQAVVQRARANAASWTDGVRAAVHALLDFLASEPAFARLALIDAPLAGPAMRKRTDEHLAAYSRLLFEGAPQRRRPPRIAPEAIVHAVVELAFHHTARDSVARLREDSTLIAYLALAPFVGVTEAAQAVAAG